MLQKLHKNHVEKTAASGAALDNSEKKEEDGKPLGRKPNFFDKKRFVNYEQNADSGDEQ